MKGKIKDNVVLVLIIRLFVLVILLVARNLEKDIKSFRVTFVMSRKVYHHNIHQLNVSLD